jgi:hypothetical protein
MSSSDHDIDDDLPDDELGDDDDMFGRREPHRQGSRVVGDFVRRAIENTMGQVQNTGAVPKEAINYLLQQTDRGRKEAVRLVAKEVGDFLRHTDISSEVVKILTNVQVDVSASLRFKRNPEGRLSTEVDEGSEVSLHGSEDESNDDSADSHTAETKD